ncbi:MAG: TIGR04282 family arsenosugar biosynthesis glycosyltransferase [Pseudomonadota bacterium]
MSLEGVAIAVLARAPVAGQAKTRLIPALGERGAARLQRLMTLRTLQTAMDSGVGDVHLWCAPDSGHRFFKALSKVQGLVIHEQPEGDIGLRMLSAFEAHLSGDRNLGLILVGTDCPGFTSDHLRQAAGALLTHDAVFTPAEDGGYVLVGLRRAQASIFESIDWSTEKVMAQTRERMRSAGLSWYEMPVLADIDLPCDLDGLAASRALPSADRLLGFGRWAEIRF